MSPRLIINELEIPARPGDSIFDCAEELAVPVPTSCLKQGKCRECLVEVVEGMQYLTPPGPEEGHLQGSFRLACRARFLEGGGDVRCHTLRRGEMRITDAAVGLPERNQSIAPDAAVRRNGDTIEIDGRAVAQSLGPIHGIAMDIGTTTVVLRLVDLESGRVLASQSFENPQRFGGSDVTSRIRYNQDNPGRPLQRILIAYINHAIERFPTSPDSIYEMTVAGNSTMRDLFFGLDVTSLGRKPFKSVTELRQLEGEEESTHLSVPAHKLRLRMHPEARVYGLPLISSHVGADTAACLLAIDLAHDDRTVALMDIGTNTELVLGRRDNIVAASCPAGPAFEGAAIACGMPGLEGAIERIRLDGGERLNYQVIGGGLPEGVCGSGLVDLLGELLRTGGMNRLGRLSGGADRVWIDRTHHLFVTEREISELAKAKAANVSGLRIVSRHFGIDFEQIDVFYLAGGFARHLDLAACRRIGLIPDLPDDRFVQVGNAAIEGATIALINRHKRAELEHLARAIEHVQLESDPEFFNEFVTGIQFVPFGSKPLS